MSEAADKLADPLARIADVMARGAEAAEKAVSNHGADTVELVLLAARIEAGQVLAKGFAFLVGAALVLIAWRKTRAWYADADWDAADSFMPRLIARAALALVGGAWAIMAAMRFATLKAWVGLFIPEYWIAMKAMEAVL